MENPLRGLLRLVQSFQKEEDAKERPCQWCGIATKKLNYAYSHTCLKCQREEGNVGSFEMARRYPNAWMIEM